MGGNDRAESCVEHTPPEKTASAKRARVFCQQTSSAFFTKDGTLAWGTLACVNCRNQAWLAPFYIACNRDFSPTIFLDVLTKPDSQVSANLGIAGRVEPFFFAAGVEQRYN